LINRRHALGLVAAAGILPSRGFAHVAPQRSEIREDLAKRFADDGTAGTFVGYKVDDYLVIYLSTATAISAAASTSSG
jgi:beta-lactamase class D